MVLLLFLIHQAHQLQGLQLMEVEMLEEQMQFTSVLVDDDFAIGSVAGVGRDW